MGNQLPWSRRKRKRLMTAKNIVIHMFSGADTQYWERRLANEHTEVLCVDLNATISANVLDDVTFAYLLSLCASGRVKALIDTLHAERCQRFGFKMMMDHLCCEQKNILMDFLLVPQQAELVFNDSVLWFTFLLMYIMCAEVRHEEEKTTALAAEQPKDPKNYKSEEEVGEKGFMSMWRTQEWLDVANTCGADLISFDQGPMVHECRKPTTLAVISISQLHQLQLML